ncbi:MAG: CBS domain-containing protein [Candidatus Bathyarchaeota archaeon]|nr:CBS domain-containing protein [Candidatus Bathyarchaeota archaeon]
MSDPEAEGYSEEKIAIPLKAEDVMATEVLTLDENTSVKEAAEIMAKEGFSYGIVTADGKAVGIMTERDILKRIVAEDRDPRKTKVKHIMSSPLVVIERGTDLEKASRLMFEKEIKNLPVVDNNRLVGLVNLTDICRVQPEIFKALKQTMETPKNIKKILDRYIV